MKIAERIQKLNAERGRLNRQVGLNFEFRVLRKYKNDSRVAFTHRSQGSFGPVDVLVQFKDKRQYLISCKNNGYWHPKELTKLQKLKECLNEYQQIKRAFYVSPKKWVLRDL